VKQTNTKQIALKGIEQYGGFTKNETSKSSKAEKIGDTLPKSLELEKKNDSSVNTRLKNITSNLKKNEDCKVGANQTTNNDTLERSRQQDEASTTADNESTVIETTLPEKKKKKTNESVQMDNITSTTIQEKKDASTKQSQMKNNTNGKNKNISKAIISEKKETFNKGSNTRLNQVIKFQSLRKRVLDLEEKNEELKNSLDDANKKLRVRNDSANRYFDQQRKQEALRKHVIELEETNAKAQKNIEQKREELIQKSAEIMQKDETLQKHTFELQETNANIQTILEDSKRKNIDMAEKNQTLQKRVFELEETNTKIQRSLEIATEESKGRWNHTAQKHQSLKNLVCTVEEKNVLMQNSLVEATEKLRGKKKDKITTTVLAQNQEKYRVLEKYLLEIEEKNAKILKTLEETRVKLKRKEGEATSLSNALLHSQDSSWKHLKQIGKLEEDLKNAEGKINLEGEKIISSNDLKDEAEHKERLSSLVSIGCSSTDSTCKESSEEEVRRLQNSLSDAHSDVEKLKSRVGDVEKDLKEAKEKAKSKIDKDRTSDNPKDRILIQQEKKESSKEIGSVGFGANCACRALEEKEKYIGELRQGLSDSLSNSWKFRTQVAEMKHELKDARLKGRESFFLYAQNSAWKIKQLKTRVSDLEEKLNIKNQALHRESGSDYNQRGNEQHTLAEKSYNALPPLNSCIMDGYEETIDCGVMPDSFEGKNPPFYENYEYRGGEYTHNLRENAALNYAVASEEGNTTSSTKCHEVQDESLLPIVMDDNQKFEWDYTTDCFKSSWKSSVLNDLEAIMSKEDASSTISGNRFPLLAANDNTVTSTVPTMTHLSNMSETIFDLTNTNTTTTTGQIQSPTESTIFVIKSPRNDDDSHVSDGDDIEMVIHQQESYPEYLSKGKDKNSITTSQLRHLSPSESEDRITYSLGTTKRTGLGKDIVKNTTAGPTLPLNNRLRRKDASSNSLNIIQSIGGDYRRYKPKSVITEEEAVQISHLTSPLRSKLDQGKQELFNKGEVSKSKISICKAIDDSAHLSNNLLIPESNSMPQISSMPHSLVLRKSASTHFNFDKSSLNSPTEAANNLKRATDEFRQFMLRKNSNDEKEVFLPDNDILAREKNGSNNNREEALTHLEAATPRICNVNYRGSGSTISSVELNLYENCEKDEGATATSIPGTRNELMEEDKNTKQSIKRTKETENLKNDKILSIERKGERIKNKRKEEKMRRSLYDARKNNNNTLMRIKFSASTKEQESDSIFEERMLAEEEVIDAGFITTSDHDIPKSSSILEARDDAPDRDVLKSDSNLETREDSSGKIELEAAKRRMDKIERQLLVVAPEAYHLQKHRALAGQKEKSRLKEEAIKDVQSLMIQLQQLSPSVYTEIFKGG